MKKQRQSNIELLRILAIFFVLIGHAGIANGGLLPDMNDFRSDTLASGIKLTLSCVTVGGRRHFRVDIRLVRHTCR